MSLVRNDMGRMTFPQLINNLSRATKLATKAKSLFGKRKRETRNRPRKGRILDRNDYLPAGVKIMDARSGQPALLKRRRSRPKKKVSISKRLKTVEQKVADQNDVVIIRGQTEGQMSVADNNAIYYRFYAGTRTQKVNYDGTIEGRQLDAGVTSQVTVTPDNLSAKVGMKVIQSLEIRNNHKIPARIDCTWYECVDDVSEDPYLIQEDVYAGYGITLAGDVQWTMNIPFESALKKYWRKKKNQQFLLNAGDAVDLSNISRYLRTNEENWKERNFTYLKGLSMCLVIRVQGVVAHDQTTTTLVGWGDCTLDYILKEQIRIDMPGTGIKVLKNSTDAVDDLTTPVVFGPNVIEIKEDS